MPENYQTKARVPSPKPPPRQVIMADEIELGVIATMKMERSLTQ
jgi:hypothetical protein